MINILIIQNNDLSKVGDIVVVKNNLAIISKNKNKTCFELNNNKNYCIEKIHCKKVDIHIIDDEIDINLNDYFCNTWIFNDKRTYKFLKIFVRKLLNPIEDKNKKNYGKAIATSDKTLELPQLSNIDINLIIEKNSNLNNADVKYVTPNHKFYYLKNINYLNL